MLKHVLSNIFLSWYTYGYNHTRKEREISHKKVKKTVTFRCVYINISFKNHKQFYSSSLNQLQTNEGK